MSLAQAPRTEAEIRSVFVAAFLEAYYPEDTRPTIARQLGVRPEDLRDPDAFVPLQAMVDLHELLAVETQDPYFGLKSGINFHPSQLGVGGYVASRCANVRDAIGALQRYQRLNVRDVPTDIELSDRHVRFVHRPSVERRRHFEEGVLAFDVGSVRALVGEAVVPVAVTLATGPADENDLSAYREHLGVTPSFGTRDSSVTFEREVFDRPVTEFDPDLMHTLRPQIDPALRSKSDSLRDQVRRAVTAEICHGPPSVANVASRLGTSERTLQRRLATEGLSYSDLVREVRESMAKEYLVLDPKRPIAEICYLLGYTDVSSFHRAFRSWTGHPPASYRRTELAAQRR